VLTVEDIGEHLHRLDRMWTHLRLAGQLSRLAGLALGSFNDCPPTPPPAAHSPLSRIHQELPHWVTGPVVQGVPYGHHPRRLTLPLGLAARLNTRRGAFEVLESAVS
jgi:muramoyltetrapeptide carboxypeptidase